MVELLFEAQREVDRNSRRTCRKAGVLPARRILLKKYAAFQNTLEEPNCSTRQCELQLPQRTLSLGNEDRGTIDENASSRQCQVLHIRQES